MSYQVSNRFNASFGELVSPTLRNAQIVVDIETSILIGKVAIAITTRNRSKIARIIRT